MAYQPRGAVENYTNAFLAVLWAFLFMVFWTIAAIMGFAWVLITAYGLDHLFRCIGRRRQRGITPPR